MHGLTKAIEDLTRAIAGSPVVPGAEPQTRIVFLIGAPVERIESVVPTPQFQGDLKGEVLSMSQLPYTHQSTLTAKPLDSKGNPASVDGVPEWLVDNSELLAIEPSADGLSCVCAALGPLGTASVTVRMDADLGEGVEHLLGTHEYEITGGKATTIELEASEPIERLEINPLKGKRR